MRYTYNGIGAADAGDPGHELPPIGDDGRVLCGRSRVRQLILFAVNICVCMLHGLYQFNNGNNVAGRPISSG